MRATTWMMTLLLAAGCGSDQGSGGDEKTGTKANAAEPDRAAKVDAIGGEAGAAIRAMLKKDASLKKFFHGAHGFAIFPTIGKGGLIVGGGGGSGYVFEQGEPIGTTKVTFLSVGAQVGGQSMTEVIFFKDKAALDNFKRGNFEFGAQVNAVAVDAGAALDAGYDKGVAVFTLPKKGLMAEASVSGQKFSFRPK